MSCPDCFQGAVNQEEPRGKIINIYGLETYVSEPADGKQVKGIIVIIPDAFGWEFVNNRILADHFVDKSDYKVYLPDFMKTHAAPVWMLDSVKVVMTSPNYLSKAYHAFWAIMGVVPFIYHNRFGKSEPVVRGFFEQLRKEEGSTLSIGAAGYCWGGKHTVTLAHGAEIDGKPLIDAGFTGHPSMLSFPGDIEKLKLPVSFALSETDNQVSPEQGQLIKRIVEANEGAAKGEVRVYEKAGHGFCVRADVQFKDVAKQASDAEDQCLAWFQKHFKAV